MGALKALRLASDANQKTIDGAVVAGGWVDCRLLAAGVAEVHTVPAGAKFVLISVTGNVYINFGTAAAIPAADVINGSASILMVNTLPRIFELKGAATIGVIAPAIQTVTLEFFK